MPASEIELRVQQAADFAKAEPESFSAPPEGNLCEASLPFIPPRADLWCLVCSQFKVMILREAAVPIVYR